MKKEIRALGKKLEEKRNKSISFTEDELEILFKGLKRILGDEEDRDARKMLPDSWELLKKADQIIKEISRYEYDGLAGELPDWVPDPLKHQFNTARVNFLKYYDYQRGKGDFDECLKMLDDFDKGEIYASLCLKQARPHLESLVYVFRLVRLGKTECYQAYLGEGGHEIYNEDIQSARQRKIAKRARPDALQSMIVDILQQNPNANKEKILSELENKARDGIIESINRDDEIIEWVDKNGKIKDAPFSGLKARIYRAKKKLKML